MTQKNKDLQSPFFAFGITGNNPFVYKGIVYRFNATVTTIGKALELLTYDPLKRQLAVLDKEKPVVIGIVEKVFDDPLLGGIVVPDDAKEEVKKEAKLANDFFVEMNGIEFHRQYYDYMIKPTFEGFLKIVSEVDHPDELSIKDFLYIFAITFFAKYLLNHEKSSNPVMKKADFLKKSLTEEGGLNLYDYNLDGEKLPEGRECVHFAVWEK